MPKSTGEDWLGTTDAHRYLGVTLRFLYRVINDGELRAYRLGRVIRIRRTDLDAFLERQVIKPGELTHLLPDVADEDSDQGKE